MGCMALHTTEILLLPKPHIPSASHPNFQVLSRLEVATLKTTDCLLHILCDLTSSNGSWNAFLEKNGFCHLVTFGRGQKLIPLTENFMMWWWRHWNQNNIALWQITVCLVYIQPTSIAPHKLCSRWCWSLVQGIVKGLRPTYCQLSVSSV